MFGGLPRPLVSKTGFQGCFASFETNGELLDPVKHALVPSPLVEEGCEGTLNHTTSQGFFFQPENMLYSTLESVAYEWGSGNGGVIRFTYPSDKRPDTNSDLLSLGFITPSIDAVLARIDSHHDSDRDFIQLEIVRSNIY